MVTANNHIKELEAINNKILEMARLFDATCSKH